MEFAITRQRIRMKGREGRKERGREKEKIESDRARAPIILEILRRDSAIYLRRTSERVQQNTIGETGQRRVKKWRRRRWGRRKKRVDGARGRRWRGGGEREREREDEKDAEVMAVVAVEVSGGGGGDGGVFTKSQAESAAPFVDATGGVRERTKRRRRRTGVASER